jgi:hypothetical protein
MLRRMKAPLRLTLGNSVDREDQRLAAQSLTDCSNSLVTLRNLLPEDFLFSESTPIFILSAGWRSGSTLVQRLICDETTLVWGEPYDKYCIIQHISEMLAPFSNSWPPKTYYMTEFRGDLQDSWIANLYPSPEDLVTAIYSLFESLFEKPSRIMGFDNWGLKEVRLGYNEVLALNFLYPKAKFVYVHRALESAYSSYVALTKNAKYYSRWPHKIASTPFRFAKVHSKLLGDFVKLESQGLGTLIAYENIVDASEELRALEEYIGKPINYAALNSIVGNSIKKVRVSGTERLLLRLGRRSVTANLPLDSAPSL